MTTKLGTFVKQFDAFGAPIKLKLDGKDYQKSYYGALMTVLMITITLIYGS